MGGVSEVVGADHRVHLDRRHRPDYHQQRTIAALTGLFIIYTGCRRSEACKLEWSDIDFEEKLITYRATKSGYSTVDPISKAVLHLLTELHIQIRKNVTASGAPKTPLQRESWDVVADIAAPAFNVNGKIFNITPDYLSRTMRKFFNTVNIPRDVRPVHSLKYNFATTLISNGVDLKSVSELLGHRSISTTEIYVVGIMDNKREAVELVGGY